MIIELGKYNEIRELLIRNRTTVFQAQVSYQDGLLEASVTRVAPHGFGGDRDANRVQGHVQSASESGSRPSMHADTAEQLRSISMLLYINRLREKRVGTLRSQVHQLGGLLMRWWWHYCHMMTT